MPSVDGLVLLLGVVEVMRDVDGVRGGGVSQRRPPGVARALGSVERR